MLLDVAAGKGILPLLKASIMESGMATNPKDVQRRALLQMAAGVAVAAQLSSSSAEAAAPVPTGSGKAGDFNFLSGEWKIEHRRLEGQWDRFEGEATVTGILGGVASVEELRIPSRNFSGMGLRLLDVQRGVWADYWCNGGNGLLNAPTWGGFQDGAGAWDAAELEGGQAVIVRGVWDQMTSNSCRWRQMASRDNGATWEENWIMQWRRVALR